MIRACYFAGLLAPPVFLLSVVVGGARRPGYSHLADPVSALGMAGAADASAINRAWTVSGVLLLVLGLAIWLDRTGPGRMVAGAIVVAGAVSAAIAQWFPMDPPGVPMSFQQAGHNVLVAVAALAFAAAMLAAARSPNVRPGFRNLTWVALAAMVAGAAGAASAHALGLPLLGGFERLTQAGYQVWLLLVAALGLARAWRSETAPDS